ncbi:helix-turn-helix domain-containing protein [Oscillibacter sp. GMB15532]|uniref:helix-turn-helix domain-containing protein n=1 Tax=Oscillibacter sp. GMB15532 TaxID=3230022 RepID=UPI0034DF4333
MKIDPAKLDLLLARKCKALSDLREGSSPETLKRIRKGEEVMPKTVGRIARVLNCDPADIIEEAN